MNTWTTLLLAGVLNGSFAVPMKTAKRWSFYQIWGLFSFFSMMAIPIIGVLIFVPEWRTLIDQIPFWGLCKLLLIGLLWGIAALLYGAAVELLGVAVGVSILLGLSIVIGAVVPRLLSGAHLTFSSRDELFIVGLITMVCGVIVCALSGRSGGSSRSSAQFRKGLIVAILGGIGSPLLNIGIQLGITLLAPSSENRTTSEQASWVAWALFLSAASVTQAGYCLLRTLSESRHIGFLGQGAGTELLRVAVMAAAWSGSIFLYAKSVAALGPIGPSIGWPVFIALIVLSSNLWGMFLGEWKGRPRNAFRRMVIGSALLVAATVLIAQSG